MNRKMWLSASLCVALTASCRVTYESSSKQEQRPDGTSTSETKNVFNGEAIPNGGSITTNGTGVGVTVNGPNGSTTVTPAPGESVPVPQGTTSVETEESKRPNFCPNCGHPLTLKQALAGKNIHHTHRAYHRFERFVAQGEWRGFLYAEDASEALSGKVAARGLWRELVNNLAGGFSYVPQLPAEVVDVRFYGMRAQVDNGQVYLSFADIKPFASLSVTLRELGTTNVATFDLGTPGTVQSVQNGWHVATIPITFTPTSTVNLEIELTPAIRNAGSTITKGYVHTIGWQ